MSCSDNQLIQSKMLKTSLQRTLLLIAILFCGGCASTDLAPVKMEKGGLEKLKTQSNIIAVHYKPAPFRLVTESTTMASGIGVLFGAVGGAIGAGATINKIESAGQEMVKNYSLQDPVLKVKEQILGVLNTKYGLNNIHAIPETIVEENFDLFRKQYGAGIIIDLMTINWGLGSFPFDSSHYRTPLFVRVRLVDLKDSIVLWQGSCRVMEEKTDNSPNIDEIKADNGALLKKMLIATADICAKEIIAQFPDQ
jgi:hypothetical protein